MSVLEGEVFYIIYTKKKKAIEPLTVSKGRPTSYGLGKERKEFNSKN